MSTENTSRKDRRNPVWIIIPALAVVISMALVLFIYSSKNDYTFKEAAFRTYLGQEQEIKKDAYININDAGTAILTQDGISEDISGLPVYFRNRNKVLMPDTVLYYTPDDMCEKKAESLTEFTVSPEGAVTAERNSSSAGLKRGFIYDGKDLFIFLEPVTLKINGYSFELPALSYVEAPPDTDYVIYDYGTGKYYTENPQSDATAESLDGFYTVSLVFDSLENLNGEGFLLFGDPKQIDSMFEKK